MVLVFNSFSRNFRKNKRKTTKQSILFIFHLISLLIYHHKNLSFQFFFFSIWILTLFKTNNFIFISFGILLFYWLCQILFSNRIFSVLLKSIFIQKVFIFCFQYQSKINELIFCHLLHPHHFHSYLTFYLINILRRVY